MCDIIGAVNGKKSGNFVEKVREILEKTHKKQPKDSFGIAWFEDGKLKHLKNLNPDPDNIIDTLTNNVFDCRFIIHTRKGNRGFINEQNCHPHIVKDGLLFHYGTIQEYNDWAKILLTLNKISPWEYISASDTFILSKLFNEIGKEVLTILDNPGLFLVMHKNGDIYGLKSKYADLNFSYIDGSLVFSSDFPYNTVSDEWEVNESSFIINNNASKIDDIRFEYGELKKKSKYIAKISSLRGNGRAKVKSFHYNNKKNGKTCLSSQKYVKTLIHIFSSIGILETSNVSIFNDLMQKIQINGTPVSRIKNNFSETDKKLAREIILIMLHSLNKSKEKLSNDKLFDTMAFVDMLYDDCISHNSLASLNNFLERKK